MSRFAFVKRCTLNFANERELGSGGFGTVYKGVDAQNGHCFAVKVLNLQIFQQIPRDMPDEALQRIIKAETNAFRALPQTHPNLCRLLGVCSGKKSDGSPYVMVLSSLGHRGDLASLLRKDEEAKTLTWRDRLSVARQVCKAVSFLHGQQPNPIFHRDLKSENIVMTTSLNPMLIDWALARLIPAGAQSHRVTTEAMAVGTAGYMCPQYAAERVFSPESEVYSLGVVLLELFTGKIQTDTDPQTNLVKQFAGEDLYAHDADAPPTVHPLCAADADVRAGEWDDGVATDLATLILECLRKKRRRVTVPFVLRSLCAIERKAEEARPGDEVLREELKKMRETHEREQIERDVRQQREHETLVRCIACCETVKESEGAECPRENRDHFLCSDCFGDYVRHKVEEGIEMRHGELKLPCSMAGRGCEQGAFYDQRVVALNCSTDAYRTFLEARDGSLRAAARAEVEAEVRREGAVGGARRRLEEEMMHFHKTPCCNRGFVYDGCAAVACADLCGRHFCALCHFHSDRDCHPHVATCRLNPRRNDYFVSKEELDALHRPLVARKVRSLLADLSRDQPEVHAALLQEGAVLQHLKDLEIMDQGGLMLPPPPDPPVAPPPAAAAVAPPMHVGGEGGVFDDDEDLEEMWQDEDEEGDGWGEEEDELEDDMRQVHLEEDYEGWQEEQEDQYEEEEEQYEEEEEEQYEEQEEQYEEQELHEEEEEEQYEEQEEQYEEEQEEQEEHYEEEEEQYDEEQELHEEEEEEQYEEQEEQYEEQEEQEEPYDEQEDQFEEQEEQEHYEEEQYDEEQEQEYQQEEEYGQEEGWQQEDDGLYGQEDNMWGDDGGADEGPYDDDDDGPWY